MILTVSLYHRIRSQLSLIPSISLLSSLQGRNKIDHFFLFPFSHPTSSATPQSFSFFFFYNSSSFSFVVCDSSHPPPFTCSCYRSKDPEPEISMRCHEYILQFVPLLLLWTLTALPRTQSSIFLPNNLQPIQSNPSYPFQAPLDSPKAQNDRRPWARFRNRLIRFVWNIPIEGQSRTTILPPSWETFNPPSSLKARYGSDVVLRFQIQSLEESAALSEAIYVLMLDVWEFTADWVDIRLSKDVVRLTFKVTPDDPQTELYRF